MTKMTKCVYLPTDLVEQVNRVAEARGEAFSHVVVDALEVLIRLRSESSPR